MNNIDILIISPVANIFSRSSATHQDIAQRVEMFIKQGKKVVLVELTNKETINKFTDYDSDLLEIIRIEKKDSRKFIHYRRFSLDNKYIKQKIGDVVKKYNPKVVWFEYDFFFLTISYLKKRFPKLLIHVRSHNYEFGHYWEKWKFRNTQISFFIKFKLIIRLLVDQIQFLYLYKKILKYIDTIHCISQLDKELYKKRFLKGNWDYLSMYIEYNNTYKIKIKKKIDIVYLSSNLKNDVNKEGFLRLIDIANLVKNLPVKFHCTGNDIPNDIVIPKNVICHGYVKKFEEFLDEMDVAIAPVSIGYGMKGKVYEMLKRGFPSIVSVRTEEVFKGAKTKAYIVCDSNEEWKKTIEYMLNIENRKKHSKNAIKFMKTYFSSEKHVKSMKNIFYKIY